MPDRCKKRPITIFVAQIRAPARTINAAFQRMLWRQKYVQPQMIEETVHRCMIVALCAPQTVLVLVQAAGMKGAENDQKGAYLTRRGATFPNRNDSRWFPNKNRMRPKLTRLVFFTRLKPPPLHPTEPSLPSPPKKPDFQTQTGEKMTVTKSAERHQTL